MMTMTIVILVMCCHCIDIRPFTYLHFHAFAYSLQRRILCHRCITEADDLLDEEEVVTVEGAYAVCRFKQ